MGHSSASSGGGTARGGRVTTPSGRHWVNQYPGKNPATSTAIKGSQERAMRSTVNMTSIRAGRPTISAVQTALVRQNMPTNARTFGMAPIVRVRRTPSVR